MLPDARRALEKRLDRVRDRIARACTQAGRSPDSVTLVAVTKTVDADTARALFELGVQDLGESRPQELWRKRAALPDARWHLVGHLQRNKIEATLPVHLIHSIDSPRLLRALDEEAGRRGMAADALLQVNISGEPTKQGFAPDQLNVFVETALRCRHLRLLGLMTMAPLISEPEQCRPVFSALRKLLDEVSRNHPGLVQAPELSMGMTNDFEVAIEEGATLVRIGTALFRD
jgi:pyridoxal phosphate enzyme (YggS family)